MREQNLFIDLSDPFQKPQKLASIERLLNKKKSNITKIESINLAKLEETIDTDIFGQETNLKDDQIVEKNKSPTIPLVNLTLEKNDRTFEDEKKEGELELELEKHENIPILNQFDNPQLTSSEEIARISLRLQSHQVKFLLLILNNSLRNKHTSYTI